MKKFISVITAFTIFLGSISVNSCEKDASIDTVEYQVGRLKNFTGVDNCTWVIELEDSSYLEPLNLECFDIELVENKVIQLIYFTIKTGSTCQVGTVVKITAIKGIEMKYC